MVTGFSSLAYYLQSYGIMDFLLPFLLVFTILYAVTAKVALFKDHKNFRVIIALVLSIMFVAPHIVGYYPLGYDPVQVINETLPSISLVAVAAIMLLLLMGIFGTDFAAAAAPFIAILAIVFVVYIFGSSLNMWNGPSTIFSWWTPETTELVVILLVFGVIVYLITKDPNSGTAMGGVQKLWDGVKNMVERR